MDSKKRGREGEAPAETPREDPRDKTAEAAQAARETRAAASLAGAEEEMPTTPPLEELKVAREAAAQRIVAAAQRERETARIQTGVDATTEGLTNAGYLTALKRIADEAYARDNLNLGDDVKKLLERARNYTPINNDFKREATFQAFQALKTFDAATSQEVGVLDLLRAQEVRRRAALDDATRTGTPRQVAELTNEVTFLADAIRDLERAAGSSPEKP